MRIIDDERETPITSNEYFVLLENMSRDWTDDSRNSLVDSDQGKSFMDIIYSFIIFSFVTVDAYIIRNNIGPQNES